MRAGKEGCIQVLISVFELKVDCWVWIEDQQFDI